MRLKTFSKFQTVFVKIFEWIPKQILSKYLSEFPNGFCQSFPDSAKFQSVFGKVPDFFKVSDNWRPLRLSAWNFLSIRQLKASQAKCQTFSKYQIAESFSGYVQEKEKEAKILQVPIAKMTNKNSKWIRCCPYDLRQDTDFFLFFFFNLQLFTPHFFTSVHYE